MTHPDLCLEGSGRSGEWARCTEAKADAKTPEIVGWWCKRYDKRTDGQRLECCREDKTDGTIPDAG